MEFIDMNINFSNTVKNLIPFVVLIFTVYLLNSVLYFWLPKDSIEYNVKDKVTLKYQHFGIKKSLEEKVTKQKPTIKIKKPEYQLLSNITLKAIYSINEKKAWIIVANKAGRTDMITVGELFKGYKLIRAYANYVIFEKDGEEYKLELTPDKKVNFSMTKSTKPTHKTTKKDIEKITVVDDKVSIQRTYLNDYANDFEKIWQDISIKEIRDNFGKINGFRVNRVNKKGVFHKLGLKKGDIIKAINNIELKSYNDAFNIYKDINNITHLNIKILRNNKEVELEYEIE
jgi:general secretion pathway protein C